MGRSVVADALLRALCRRSSWSVHRDVIGRPSPCVFRGVANWSPQRSLQQTSAAPQPPASDYAREVYYSEEGIVWLHPSNQSFECSRRYTYAAGTAPPLPTSNRDDVEFPSKTCRRREDAPSSTTHHAGGGEKCPPPDSPSQKCGVAAGDRTAGSADEQALLRILFDDGSPFLTVQLVAEPVPAAGDGLADQWCCTGTDQHLCGNDVYDATLSITCRAEEVHGLGGRAASAKSTTSLVVEEVLWICITYQVRGPHKDYRSRTTYSPIAGAS